MAVASTIRHPLYGPWIRGQMALHGADTRLPFNDWLDTVHATLASAPHDVLSKLNDQFIVNAVLADPVGARETWGALPEHQVKPPAETKFRDAQV